MPYLATSQLWLQQSALLLEARPSTTRITTTYSLPHPSRLPSPPPPPPTTKQSASSLSNPNPNPASTGPPIATLTLKTYDPASGVCLKYRTTKGQEVGRLISSLGRLGKGMSGREKVIVEEGADVIMGGTGEVGGDENSGRGTPVPSGGGGAAAAPGAATGGGKKKKGKGKR